MEPGVANLIVALGNNPWPCTLGLTRVQVAPNQKMCSLIEAMDSARECFNREKGLEAAHYYLTPAYTEALYLLSDAGLQAEDGTAMVIGVTTLSVNPKDNAVNLTASEGGNVYLGAMSPPAPFNRPHSYSSPALSSCMGPGWGGWRFGTSHLFIFLLHMLLPMCWSQRVTHNSWHLLGTVYPNSLTQVQPLI